MAVINAKSSAEQGSLTLARLLGQEELSRVRDEPDSSCDLVEEKDAKEEKWKQTRREGDKLPFLAKKDF